MKQIVDFYDRGGDFAAANRNNLAPDVRLLGLSETQTDDLVAFVPSLTADRARHRKAPFDPPSIGVPMGHVQYATGKLVAIGPNEPLQAAEAPYRCIAAVGAGIARQPLTPFMNTSPFARQASPSAPF